MPLCELFVYEPITNFPEVFASTLNGIPLFRANVTNACQSEVNLLELFLFLTIYGSKSNNYSTLMHKTRTRRIKICLITRKWPNLIPYLLEYYSIFALRSYTSTSKHHFFASSTIRLRLQRYDICFNDESRSGTMLRRNL